MHQQLRQFVVDTFLYGRSNGLDDDTSFLDSGIIDSTGVLELVSYLEQEYGIRLEDHELISDNLDSINKVAAFLQRKLNEQKLGVVHSAS